jgi:hypothetical protein
MTTSVIPPHATDVEVGERPETTCPRPPYAPEGIQ